MLPGPRLARIAARQASFFSRQLGRPTTLLLSLAARTPRPQPQLHPSAHFSSTPAIMSSDDAYAAFLEKANQDVSAGAPASTASKTASVNHQQNVPKVLVAAAKDQFYTSDADEPFVAVGIPLKGDKLPTEDDFVVAAGLPQPASIDILDPLDWDRNGQYTALLDAVREAGEGNDVRVYKVQQDATRVEYWLVTTTPDKGQLVGFKAKAVES